MSEQANDHRCSPGVCSHPGPYCPGHTSTEETPTDAAAFARAAREAGVL
jgi:hypothetical protein